MAPPPDQKDQDTTSTDKPSPPKEVLSTGGDHDLTNTSVVELSKMKYTEINNPLAHRSSGATIFGLIGVSAFLFWVYYVTVGYVNWKTNGGPLPDTSIVYVGIPVMFSAFFLEAIFGWIQGIQTFTVNDTISSISNGIYQQLFVAATKLFGEFVGVALITAVPYRYIYDNYQIYDIDGYVGVILCFFARDFCYYWFHRAGHRISSLWAIHGVHHRPASFNYSTNFSQGAFQRVASASFYAPLALFFCPEIYSIVYPMSKLYGFMTHTSLMPKMTPYIGWFFVTPSHHRVHHAGGPSKYIDKNYGEVMIIWDKLFGTFQPEEECIVFGHVEPHTSWDPFVAQTEVWRKLWKKAKSCKTLGEIVYCYIGPPGWDPDTSRSTYKHVEYPLPDQTPFNFWVYDSKLNTPMQIYVICHYIPIVLYSIFIIRMYNQFSSPLVFGLLSFFCVFSASSLAKVFDYTPSYWIFETLRLIFFAPFCIVIFSIQLGSGKTWNGIPWDPLGSKQSVPFLLSVLFIVLISFGTLSESYSLAQKPKNQSTLAAGRKVTDQFYAEQEKLKKSK